MDEEGGVLMGLARDPCLTLDSAAQHIGLDGQRKFSNMQLKLSLIVVI